MEKMHLLRGAASNESADSSKFDTRWWHFHDFDGAGVEWDSDGEEHERQLHGEHRCMRTVPG